MSFSLHAGLLFWGSCSLGLNAPDFDLTFEFKEIEFIDIEAEQAEIEEPVVEPPIVSGPELPPGGLPDDAPEEADAPKPEKKFGDKTARVHKLAPPASTFYMFMAAKRIKKLPYAEDFLDAFSPQKDFEFLVDGGGFHPWKDFEYMLIASSNIADPTQNFIAVSHHLGEAAIKAGINRACKNFGLEAEWIVRDGKEMVNPRPLDPEVEDKDPRWFIILDDRTAIFIRDEFLDAVIKGDDGTKKKSARNFVAQVTRMRAYARAEPNAGFTLVFKDIRKILAANTGMNFSWPNNANFTFEAADAPEVVLKVEWPSKDEAGQFVEFFENDVKTTIDDDIGLRAIVGSLYNTINVERSGRKVVLRGHLSKDLAKLMASLIAGQIRKKIGSSDEEYAKTKAMREQARAELNEEREARERGDSPEPTENSVPSKEEAPTPEPGTMPTGESPAAGETSGG